MDAHIGSYTFYKDLYRSLGQVTYRQTKGTTYVVIKVQPIKDLRGICRNQYGHPGPAIGY